MSSKSYASFYSTEADDRLYNTLNWFLFGDPRGGEDAVSLMRLRRRRFPALISAL